MTTPSRLSARTRSVCRTLVENHLPEEIDTFDIIWDAAWKSFPAQQIEDLQEPPRWQQTETAGAALAALGDTSHQAMEALYVIGSVVGAVVKLLSRNDDTFIEVTHVDTALREQAEQLNVPDHVRKILQTYGTGLLAEQLAAIDWRGSEATANAVPTGLLHVEYCEPISHTSQLSSVLTKLGSREEIQELFRRRATTFALYIDEPEGLILEDGREVAWSSFQPRQLRFLYLVLRALRHTGVVRHADIATVALRDGGADDVAIRRVKSELNDKLSIALDRVLNAERGMGQYSVARVPYCWIRLDGSTSRLCPDAPA